MNASTTFERLQNDLAEIDGIDDGGCGLAAIAMLRQLKDEDKHVTVVFGYSPFDPCHRMNEDFFAGNNERPVPATHIFLRDDDGNTFDCHGNNVEDSWTFSYFHEMDEQILIDTINNRSQWNRYFDREDIVPVFEKYGIYYQDLLIHNF